MSSADLLIVGAGLSGGLLAYRLSQRRPDLRVLLVEAGERPGGNHTWSFHTGDLDGPERDWVEPFVVHRWPAYDVRFPARQRRIGTGYASVTSERFASVLEKTLGERLLCRAEVTAIHSDHVELIGGKRMEAPCVVDARGPRRTPHLDLAFQKFLGQEVEFGRPHGLAVPTVMDATVAQDDGYRFVYCLPLSPTRMLIEDTYYADGPALEAGTVRRRIADYARAAGWGDFELLREEEGVLPIALGGDIEAHLASLGGRPTIGLAAALFHPTTGYSLPDAVRTADLVAALDDLGSRTLSKSLADHTRRTWRRRRFFRGLNRMLFGAGKPDERYRVLQHFYRLPEDLVGRFYAARLRPIDKARILFGKPPVPVVGALGALARGSA